MAGGAVSAIPTAHMTLADFLGWFFSASLQVKDIASKTSVAEHFSSSMLSQGQSSASSRGDRVSSSYGRQLNLTRESSSQSHAEESRRREELALLRTLAEMHCILAEVRVQYKHYDYSRVNHVFVCPSAMCTS